MSRCGLSLLMLAGLLAGCADPASQTGPEFAKGGPNGGGGGGSTDIPVTSNLADADASGAAFGIRSDGLGAYRNSSTLGSVIQGIGDWVLDEVNPRGATRQVYLEFSQPVPGSGPNGTDPVAFASGLFKVRMISKCSKYGHTMQGLAPGATMSCPLHIAFSQAGNDYAIQMNPIGGDADGFYEETEPAMVTCTTPSSGSGPCTGWLVAPSGPNGGNVGKLLRITTSKGKTVRADMGDYRFSFEFVVTNP